MAKAAAAPITLKRKKVTGGDGHHGGAWKVAYADFVTAMMAFFLLMWLLNATTEQQRKGLADYFAPDIPLPRISGGGSDMFGGDSPSSIEAQMSDGTTAAPGLTATAAHPGGSEEDAEAQAELASFQKIEDVLLGRGGESLVSDEAMRHVVTRLTDEGLVIELFSLPDAPLFEEDAAEPRPVTRELLSAVASIASLVTNEVAVGAHLPRRPVILRDSPVWDLSMARADRVRVLLGRDGLDPDRFARATGHADRSPVTSDPAAIRNDRIEITLLRRNP